MEDPAAAPEDPFRLSDEVVSTLAELRPTMATFWGVPGHERHDGEWDDLGPEGHARAAARLAGLAARVPKGPFADPWAQLAADVLEDHLRLERDRYAHGDQRTDLNNIASPLQIFAVTFDLMDARTEAAWSARALRLERLPAALEGYRRSLAEGLARGEVVAARQVRAAVSQCRVHAGERSFVRALPGGLAHAGLGGLPLRAQLEAAVPPACAAFARFADWLEGDYLPHARATDAVGRSRYVREARRFLGAEIDPEETYAWGFGEVARIAARMAALAEEIAPGRSVSEVLEWLKHEPTRAAPSLPALLEQMRARQREALDQLSDVHFDVPEAVRTLDVRAAPPGGPLGVYYSAPSEGFARPGCVWYSLGDPASPTPLFDQVATAYHEGFPGHHLQIGIQLSLTEKLSRLHRVTDGYSGYAEGWALYAEELMAELGYYETPEYLFGMLSCQMIRACRVVIDIGAHLELPIPSGQPFHPGEPWTFDRGVEMLTTLGGLLPDRAASEMTRYLGWPGQAISYKVGQRVFLELRAAERARLGAAFDPKRFHARVLGCGNVGLDHLRRLVSSGPTDPPTAPP